MDFGIVWNSEVDLDEKGKEHTRSLVLERAQG
jgi:hypothetical protein